MKYPYLKELVRYLKEMIKCSKCNKKFLDKDISVLALVPFEGIFQVECPRCKNTMFINIGIKDPNDPAAAINKNDVSEMEKFLTGFNGDFKNLFKLSK